MTPRIHRSLALLLLLLMLASALPSPAHAAASILNYTVTLETGYQLYTCAFSGDGQLLSVSPGPIPATATSADITSMDIRLDDTAPTVSTGNAAVLVIAGVTSPTSIVRSGTRLTANFLLSLPIPVSLTGGIFSFSFGLQIDLDLGGTASFSGTATNVAPAPTPIPVGGLSRDGFTTTPAVDLATLPQLRVAHVAEAANIRSGPGTEYPVAATLPLGAPLALAMTDGDWLQVYYNDGTALGWIHASLTAPA